MTSHTSAAKPGGIAALLLSLPDNPTQKKTEAPQDFLSTILQAMTGKPKAAEAPSPDSSKTSGPRKTAVPAPPPPPLPAPVLLSSWTVVADSPAEVKASTAPAKSDKATPSAPTASVSLISSETIADASTIAGAAPAPPQADWAPTPTPQPQRAARESLPNPAIAAAATVAGTPAAPIQSEKTDKANNPSPQGSSPVPVTSEPSRHLAGEPVVASKASISQHETALAAKPMPTAPKTTPTDLTDPTAIPPGIPEISPAASVVSPRRLPAGTPAAQGNLKMTNTAETNEIAGRTEKKVPSDSISAVSSASGGTVSSDSSKGGAKSSLQFSGGDAATPQNPPVLDVFPKLAGPALATVSTATAPAPAAHVEKLEQLISQQAASVGQAGNAVGVSLQIDGQTRLHVSLTQSNGQVQATVRCESGSFSPSDTQWTQLQQSLARQNVQLTAPPEAAAQFGSSSENQQRSSAQARENGTPDGSGGNPPRQRPRQNQNGSRQHWESWA